MKTYTATQLNKSPQEVFDAAKEDGAVVIKHDRYSKGVFAIVWNHDMPETFDHLWEGDFEQMARDLVKQGGFKGNEQ